METFELFSFKIGYSAYEYVLFIIDYEYEKLVSVNVPSDLFYFIVDNLN